MEISPSWVVWRYPWLCFYCSHLILGNPDLAATMLDPRFPSSHKASEGQGREDGNKHSIARHEFRHWH